MTDFFGAVGNALVVGLFAVLVYRLGRRDRQTAAREARRLGALDGLRGEMRDLAAEMVAAVRVRRDKKGFCAASIANRHPMRCMQVAMEPLLDGRQRAELARLLAEFFSEEARADQQAAEHAGGKLLAWLAKL